MNKKKKAKIKITICSIPFILLIVNALIQIPICMSYNYPMPMLGIDANNWFDAWLLNVGMYCIFSLIIIIPCLITILYNIYILRKSKDTEVS